MYSAAIAATVVAVLFTEKGWGRWPCIGAGVATAGAGAMAAGQIVRIAEP